MIDRPDPARRILQAYRDGQAFAAAADAGPDTPAAAYAVQRAVWQAMAGTARPTAWKVAATARDAEPIAAPVFPHRLASGPARFPAGTFIRPGIEAEIAVRFGRDLPRRAERYTRAEILAAIGSLHVAMELVDIRLADAEAAGPLWRLADNLLNGGLVIGDAIPDWRSLDFTSLSVRVGAGDRILAETAGRPPLDDLFHCLPWWVEHAGGARAGDVVTTGAWNGMHRVCPPTQTCVEFFCAREDSCQFSALARVSLEQDDCCA